MTKTPLSIATLAALAVFVVSQPGLADSSDMGPQSDTPQAGAPGAGIPEAGCVFRRKPATYTDMMPAVVPI